MRPDDAGTYFCNVETYGEPLDQAHTLDVLVPPSVQVCWFSTHHHHHYHYLTGATLQWKVCCPLRFDDHVGVSSPGKPNAKGGLDQTGKRYDDLDDEDGDCDDEDGDDCSHDDQEVLYPNLIISELNDAVGGEEQSRELCGCRTGLSISVIMIFDDSTIGQK